MLERIPLERKHKAIRLLQFLVYSDRPLELEEAIDLIAVRMNGNEGSFNPEDRMPDPSEVIGFCPSLVSLVLPTTISGGPKLHLAHFSVKEYLLRHQPHGFRNTELQIGVAETCMAYLSSVPPQDDINPTLAWEFPVSTLAITMFGKAAVEYETFSEEAAAAVLLFLTAGNLRHHFFSYAPSIKPSNLDPERALYHACRIGLLRTTKTLVSEGFCVNNQIQYIKYGYPIGIASANGHREIVEFLLSMRASVIAYDDPRPTLGIALRMASAHGHTGIAKLLIDNGADVNWLVEHTHRPNALSAASGMGYAQVQKVDILL